MPDHYLFLFRSASHSIFHLFAFTKKPSPTDILALSATDSLVTSYSFSVVIREPEGCISRTSHLSLAATFYPAVFLHTHHVRQRPTSVSLSVHVHLTRAPRRTATPPAKQILELAPPPPLHLFQIQPGSRRRPPIHPRQSIHV
ncbi:hypothetical protein LY78DRAFT_336038 [Colletotrichum sublineola]|nr:hypothetical protein LY78DRAFT_336038 [Colletotrichum sublineola]